MAESVDAKIVVLEQQAADARQDAIAARQRADKANVEGLGTADLEAAFTSIQKRLASVETRLALLQEEKVILMRAAGRAVAGGNASAAEAALENPATATTSVKDAGGAGPSATLANDAVQQFWLHLPEACLKDEFLDLKQGTFFLGEKKRGSSLLARKSYTELMKVLMELVERGITKIVITGSPGIGKSVSILYIMWYLVKISDGKPPVIVLQALGCPVLCFQGASVKTGTINDFELQLNDPDTWLLVDGMQPVFRPATTLVFTSPNRDVYSAFMKQLGSTLRFMPVWSLEELEQCRRRLYGDLTVDGVVALYERWGGRPRYVLEKALDDVHQQELLSMIGSSDLNALIRSWGQHRGEDAASDRLLEIRVEPDYKTTTMGFASDFIANKVTESLLRTKEREVQLLLAASVDISSVSTVAGKVFEIFAHKLLCAGGDFDVRELSASTSLAASPPLHLPPSKMLRFRTLEAVKAAGEDQYCCPLAPNFACVDSLKKPNMLFQMTTSLNHPILLPGLNAAINALGLKEEEEVCFYFPVPPSIFSSFAEQPLVPGKAVPQPLPTSRSRAPARPVRQFALKIELSCEAKSSGRVRGIVRPTTKLHAVGRQPACMHASRLM